MKRTNTAKISALALCFVVIASLFAGCAEKDAGDTGSDDAEKRREVTVVNPMRKITDAEEIKSRSRGLVLPEGATGLVCYLYNEKLFEMRFELDGVAYSARTAGADSFGDISGMYYAWTAEEKMTCGGIDGVMKRHIGEKETIDVACWYDRENGVNRSLSAVGADLDGFDISAIVCGMIAGK